MRREVRPDIPEDELTTLERGRGDVLGDGSGIGLRVGVDVSLPSPASPGGAGGFGATVPNRPSQAQRLSFAYLTRQPAKPRMRSLQSKRDVDASERPDSRVSSSESAVIRNYDAAETHAVTVTVTDSTDETVINRSVTVGPSAASSLRLPLERGVYHVEVTDDDGAGDSTECPIGSNPDECAVIECGNGIVSVTALAVVEPY